MDSSSFLLNSLIIGTLFKKIDEMMNFNNIVIIHKKNNA